MKRSLSLSTKDNSSLIDEIKERSKEENKEESKVVDTAKPAQVHKKQTIKPRQTVVGSLTGRIIKTILPGEVYIGREAHYNGWTLTASKWANPYKVNEYNTLTEVLDKYREYLYGQPKLMKAIPELIGKRLMCWCWNEKRKLGGIVSTLPLVHQPLRCHGDILAKLANEINDTQHSK
jgi:hypothetical protein